jgi:hypothetical protein
MAGHKGISPKVGAWEGAEKVLNSLPKQLAAFALQFPPNPSFVHLVHEDAKPPCI